MSVKTAKRATATKSSVELLPGWHDIYNGGKGGRKPDDFETKFAQGLSCIFPKTHLKKAVDIACNIAMTQTMVRLHLVKVKWAYTRHMALSQTREEKLERSFDVLWQ